MKKIILLLNILFLTASLFGEENVGQKTDKPKSDNDIVFSLNYSFGKNLEDTYNYIRNNKNDTLKLRLKEIILTEKDGHFKDHAIIALKIYHVEENLDLWLEILRSTQSAVLKKDIIELLAPLHNRICVTAFSAELANPFFSVRESAIKALKTIGDDRMYTNIMVLANHDDTIFRVYALEAMYWVYDARFYYFIMNMLKDENKSIRYYTLRCIEKNNITEALPQIRIIAAKDPNWEVQQKGVELIGKFRDSQGLSVVLKTLTSDERDLRMESVLTLKLLAVKSSASDISKQLSMETDDQIKDMMIDTLLMLKNNNELKGLYRVLLEDKNETLKIKSAYALGKLDNSKSVSVLIDALGDQSIRVRAEICSALGNYKSNDAIAALLSIIKYDQERYTRTAALYSLDKINDKNVSLSLFDQFILEKDFIFKGLLEQSIRRYLAE